MVIEYNYGTTLMGKLDRLHDGTPSELQLQA